MKGSNRLVWKRTGFAKRLQSFGYAAVAVDLRKHGQSVRDNVKSRDLRAVDYKAMVAYDLEAVKKFVLEEHHKKNLNIRKTAIIAPGMSATIAAIFAYRDWMKKPYPDAPTLAARTPRGQDIRALILLSPTESVPGLNAGKSFINLRTPVWKVAFLVGYGKGDVVDRGGRSAKRIYQKVSAIAGNKKRMYLESYPTKLRGTDMLGRGLKLETNILNFLKLHLKSLPGEWQDRHSRLE